MRAAALALALLLVPAITHAADIPAAVDRAVTAAPFDKALWFVLVEDESGKELHALNAQKLAIPASVRKLFAATTVAVCLGPDTRLRTELWRDGQDLVLRGDGDPTFGSDRYGYDPRSTFRPFISELKSRRITTARDVVADVSLFDRTTLPGGWKLGNIISYYAAPVDALAFDENEVEETAVASPGLYTASVFREQLELNGIAVTGMIRLNTVPRAWPEYMGAVESPFVRQILSTVLKNSNNLYAEMLYKRVAPAPASYDQAREIETQFLATEPGIAAGETRFVDGCGLAPDDLVTPRAVVKLLRWLNDPARRPFFYELMAIPGQPGTLRLRLTDFGERIHAKTGSVNGVNTLGGIVRGRDGSYRYFFVAINHHTGSSGKAVELIDSIVREIGDF